ncbi:MAG: dipeptide ABC transporter ATP-binding protein [Pseudomonadota bacterium]
MSLVQARNLSITINSAPILKSVSFDLAVGETLGLVGESGSGKSMTALSLIRLLPSGAKLSGSLEFAGKDLINETETALCQLRGSQISMAFQEPMTALNPVQTIGAQVAEVFMLHQQVSRTEALELAATVLERVGLPPTKFPLSRYPFELSGGQRQRVVIAIAVALKPKLLIADEPTTALDVTTEAQILDLLQTLCIEDNISLLFISHDLAVVARLADRIAVMKEGEIVEMGETVQLFEQMQHPYSLALRDASMFSLTKTATGPAEQPVLEVKNVTCDYELPRTSFFAQADTFRAVDNVSFVLHAGENLGIVGESGSGKSTLVRAVLGLEPLQTGSVDIEGTQFWPASSEVQKTLRKKIQAVFQDPFGSFNPRHKVERIVAEPLYLLNTKMNASERRNRVVESLESVGLSTSDINKYPHEFSGGQRQRIAIARALVVSPSIVVLDEATSALDVSVRVQILELLTDLSNQLGISYIFVSHDLDVVRAVTDRVLIMQTGSVAEQGPTARIFELPEHAYTKSLIGAKTMLHDEIEKRKHASNRMSQ